ncbi:MAG: hypothetical protein ACXVY9_04330 [Terriglobales bacterium]
MKKTFLILAVLLAAVAWASDKQESVDSLKARLAKTPPKEQVELLLRITERQVEAMDKAFTEGNIEVAQAALADVEKYGVEAANTSAQSGKRMKQTEIALRKMTLRMESIRKTLEVDDRPPVAEAIQKIENARSELLNRMFRK